MKQRVRKWGLGLLLILWIGVAYMGFREVSGEATTLTKVTLGYQKADILDISKERGFFEEKMKAKGYKVVWKEFQDGSSLMQAVKSGEVDYARLGDTPPVIAQASGTELSYIAAGSTRANGSGILVAEDSGIASLNDLKGKKIAYTKGTSSEFLLRNALKKAGISTADVQLVNLDSSAASVAFSKGKVAAWSTWDPMTSTAEIQQKATLLVDGNNDVSNNREYIVATQTYAKEHPAISKYLIEYMQADMDWANQHHSELIEMLSESLNLSETIIKKMVERRTFGLTSVDQTILAEQQVIADLFYEEKVIDKKITITDTAN